MHQKPPGNDLAGTRFHLLNVEHYWLCELCAQIFTLVAIQGDRVVLTPRCTELPAEDSATLTAQDVKQRIAIKGG
jgi:hypothetical protein